MFRGRPAWCLSGFMLVFSGNYTSGCFVPTSVYHCLLVLDMVSVALQKLTSQRCLAWTHTVSLPVNKGQENNTNTRVVGVWCHDTSCRFVYSWSLISRMLHIAPFSCFRHPIKIKTNRRKKMTRDSGISATYDFKVEKRPHVKSFNPSQSGPRQKQGTHGWKQPCLSIWL